MKKLILVVGASGAGKDSLLKVAKLHFRDYPNVHFLRRYITRKPGEFEDNFYVDDIAFEILKDHGFFFSFWYAHDLKYGVPRQEIESLKENETIIVSISRTKIREFEQRFSGKVTTINITAEESIIKERLERRKRESSMQIKTRLERMLIPVSASNLINFENNAGLEISSVSFLSILKEIMDSH